MASTQEEARPLLTSNQHNTPDASHRSSAKKTGDADSSWYRVRNVLKWFLGSKYGHYFVLVLVSLDVCGIFATFLIELHICEHSNEDVRVWQAIAEGLEALSLTFSCLFMAELLCSIYAFGLRYFSSRFHCFDALSILASFLVDVLSHGVLEEAGSLIIVLRLFRVFKIIEESSTVAEESLGELHERLSELEKENNSLRRRIGRNDSAEEV